MKITNQNYYQYNNPQFQRISVRIPVISRISKSDTAYYASNVLKEKEEDIFRLIQDEPLERVKILKMLAEKYNRKYFSEINKKLVEKTSLVLKIYNAITDHSSKYKKFIDNYEGTFELLDRIVQDINNDTQKLSLARNVNEKIITRLHSARPELIAELLESKHSDKYAKNFEKYRNYIVLNRKDENLVKNLDELVETRQFNPSKYENEIIYRTNRKKYPFKSNTEYFNDDMFAKNFTEDRKDIIKEILMEFYIKEKDLRNSSGESLSEIFLSTNSKNIDIRTSIIRKTNKRYATILDNDKNVKLLDELNKLFKRIDEDKRAKSFVKHSIDKHAVALDVEMINKVLDTVPINKLNLYKKNAYWIIHNTKQQPNSLEILSKEIDNPNFNPVPEELRLNPEEDLNFVGRMGFRLFKASRNLVFRIKKSIYEKILNTEEKVKNVSKENVSNNQPIETIVEKQAITPRSEVIKQEITKEITQKDSIPTQKQEDSKEYYVGEVFKNIKDVLANIKTDVEPKTAEVKTTEAKEVLQGISFNLAQPFANINTKIQTLQSRIKEKTIDKLFKSINKNIKKEETQNEVLNITNQKLGAKTFEKQKDLFAKNATQMRLGLLPEMFASIADTRKTSRMIGKTHNVSSNKDVLELYLLTNGTNKKLINYMLKKRNVDNSRMFEIKDIIQTIKAAEAKIAKAKKENANYKTNDARKYYNHLYEAKIEQYGKVKRQSTKSKNI